MALLETRIKAPQQREFFQRLFSNWCFTSNISMHKGGRIIVAWNPDVFQVYQIIMNSQYIHMQICLKEKNWLFNANVVYGYNSEMERKSLWKNFKELNETQPWSVMEDFNEILYAEDRIGRRAHNRPGKDFIDFVEQCGLEDVKYSGSRYTWTHK